MLRLIALVGVLIFLDIYVFQGVKMIASNSGKANSYIIAAYWIINGGFLILTAVAALTFSRDAKGFSPLFTFALAMLVLLFIPKIVLAAFLLSEDIFRVVKFLYSGVRVFFNSGEEVTFDSRRAFFSQVGGIASGLPFLAILYGITKGKYNYKVHRVTLSFHDLPDEFDGFTITQLSDIHAGSFDNAAEVERGVQLANDQRSDIIVFTGDLVNKMADEMDPWTSVFKKLEAPHGKYSVFGNHDYGDYIHWDSAEIKKRNLERLKVIHAEMGFNLLLNANASILKNGQSITVAGVENWGLPPFPQYGNLKMSLKGVADNAFKILLSHDPSHWDAEVKKHDQPIHLTLAGHTHGMQFGIEIPGIKWSPVKYRYPKWAGLYEENKKHLYVNRGFGFIGFPGRVGIWPEITVITLKKFKD